MSLMAKLTQSWNNDIDSVRDAIVDNVCDLISSRAPLRSEMLLSEKGTIAELGMRNMARAQSKNNTSDIVAEIEVLVRNFEPRLSQVEIDVQEGELGSNQLSFRLSAVVHSELGDEAIVLDSFLDLSSNKLDVRKSNFV
ncbi:type VI secretion system baseplate subunit TssE [Vibrio aestuarianus]|uniref:Type VI secretion system baseplate subunit TssE n=1 Tax=Vibrio aestuarianus TaxID=28171 RepID=A0A9X4F8B6_9VIBR|nr:type VI secretion system baseplate subunit TssE [Vibrio aestuarianus]MDE1236149.1 type VI secretion system baseplate subunit TssE [Vibrio aestuarianus]MDE1247017.1 type VI secretion system baseplate subunit TssE [Vibrio aestuarianus]MDE1346133.1 type VI secretion system baseplate subunit TssE [Vibrio aestuarianus]NGZ64110.1 type VI secretion system baseplate subunit TssE [Vibrio aestuarianus subsp. cardii]NGZ65775.1 type VI secretion system baseplate subunit TssE [Vibrio aestuarianus subsp.